jgi:hypothetical protein
MVWVSTQPHGKSLRGRGRPLKNCPLSILPHSPHFTNYAARIGIVRYDLAILERNPLASVVV